MRTGHPHDAGVKCVVRGCYRKESGGVAGRGRLACDVGEVEKSVEEVYIVEEVVDDVS